MSTSTLYSKATIVQFNPKFVHSKFIMIGTILGLLFGALFIRIMQGVYIGPPIGYFPIYYNLEVFMTGAVFGILTSLGAGYFPAKKAA